VLVCSTITFKKLVATIYTTFSTPSPLCLQPKALVTDAAVDMSHMDMIHHDATMRDLVCEGTKVGLPPHFPMSVL
jgi:hypothetical protein